jgi:membrane protein DedA with SNARE-associated domain/rhodanese-related sulfurtransferase
MSEALEFISRHGALVLFLVLFVEQSGLPFPASPFLLVAGGLIGMQRLAWLPALVAGVAGSMVADLIWFYIGLRTGHRALKLLCRVSMEPDSCVRHTQDLLARYGVSGLIVGKFVPGFSTLLPPMAAGSGMGLGRFIAADLISSVLYCGTLMLLGFVFRNQLEQLIGALTSLGHSALVMLGVGLLTWLAYKAFQRQHQLRQLDMPRMTVDELRQRLDATPAPVILDLRSPADRAAEPWLIPGAIPTGIQELEPLKIEIPPNQDIVLYCSCPNEVTSAKAARLLKPQGFAQCRPLLGGWDAWRARQFPVTPIANGQEKSALALPVRAGEGSLTVPS